MPVFRVWMTAAGLLLASAHGAGAQTHGTSLSGTVRDRSGGVLDDARVEVTGTGPTLVFTTEADGRFRFVDLPPGEYRVEILRAGFRPIRHEAVRITGGERLTLLVTLDIDSLDETVSVAARRDPAASRLSFTPDTQARLPGSPEASSLVQAMPGVVGGAIDVGGSESHQPPQFIFRGSRMSDTTWTIDGVVVTDPQSGAPPGFTDTRALDEIQFSPAGEDPTRPGGGLAVNMAVRSGTSEFRGDGRATLSHHALQSSNLRDDLRGAPYFVTADTADHTRQVTDAGGAVGGPLLRGRTWFWAYASRRDVRIHRQASGPERAVLTPRTVKINWQTASGHGVNGLWLDHGVERFGVNPSALAAAPTALQNDFPYHAGTPLRGLWKIEARRVVTPGLFATARYAYYGTGSQSLSAGTGQAGMSPRLGQTIGATVSSWSHRPQHSAAADASYFARLFGAEHQIAFGGGWRRTDMLNQTVWPGHGIVAFDHSLTDRRARIYREAFGRHRLVFVNAYVGDTIALGRWHLELGARLDYQRAEALPSALAGSPAFPELVPALDFAGERHRPTFDLSPRLGVSYALDSSGSTVLRASVGRHASQLIMANVAQTNPAGVAAWIEYPWADGNGDLLAQPDEVRIDLPYLAFAGLIPERPSEPVAPAILDPDMTSRIMRSLSVTLERALAPDTNVSIGYHYSRHSRWPAPTWRGLGPGDYPVVRTITETLPDGSLAHVPIHVPDREKVIANGSQRMFVTDPSFLSTYHGLEASLHKRLSDGWMLGVTGALNDSRGFYRSGRPESAPGNPTRLDGAAPQLTGPREPRIDGGQIAPATTAAAGGQVFLSSRWQLTVFGAYQLPWGLDLGGSLFGREGTPSPYYVPQSLGLDGTRRVLLTPLHDSVRLDDVWNLDLRIARRLRHRGLSVQVTADLFNALNGSAALMRDRNLRSATFDRVTMNVSPRILRVGLGVSF